MIWVRRAISVLVGSILLVILLMTLVMFQVQSMFLNPDFYTSELSKADAYEFALHDMITVALEEAREIELEAITISGVDGNDRVVLNENPLTTSGLSTEEIVTSIGRAVPPEWVQDIVEQWVDQFGGYLTGERDDFVVTLEVGKQVPILVGEVQTLLHKGDAYGLLLKRLVEPEIGSAVNIYLPLDMEVPSNQLLASVRNVIEPDWVQEHVEAILYEVTPYIMGDRDTFEINVQFGERIELSLQELKVLLRETKAYDALYSQVIEQKIEDGMGESIALPFGIKLTNEDVTNALRQVVPVDWVQEQTENIIDEITPYILGDRDTFEINVRLDERVELALQELKVLLREADVYEVLYSQVVEPEVEKSLGEVVTLPFGIGVTNDEVINVLRQVASADWVQEQTENIIDGASPYLTGKEDGFAVRVSVEENKRRTADIIEGIVQEVLDGIIRDIPKCSGTQLPKTGQYGLPSCMPAQVNLRAFIDDLDIDIANKVQELILSPIPNEMQFTDVHLRSALEQTVMDENLELIDDMRKILRDGWTYTQVDLRHDLIRLQQDGQASSDDIDLMELHDDIRDIVRNGWTYTQADLHRDLTLLQQDERASDDDADLIEVLDNVREILKDGWTYTDVDFRKDLVSSNSDQALADVDTARTILRTVHTYRWFGYIPIISLLVTIGFLGGRSWTGRVAWGAGGLLVTAGLVFIIFGPGYDVFGKSGPIYHAAQIESLDELRTKAHIYIDREVPDFPRTVRMAVDKGLDLAESISDDFAAGVAATARNLAIIGLLVMTVAVSKSKILSSINNLPPLSRRTPDPTHPSVVK